MSMKVVILCGGKGTRLREETEFKPKPLVMIGHRPMLWHIMKIYAHYGFNEFILALGYKGDMIKEYFLHQRTYLSNFTLDTKTNEVTFHNNQSDDFKVTFVETGEESNTGERVRRVREHLTGEHFMLTYGDGVADINMQALLEFHMQQKTLGTISGVHPLTHFGVVVMDQATKMVSEFHQSGVIKKGVNALQLQESPHRYLHDYINGGFMVFNRGVLDLIAENSVIEEVFAPLAARRQLSLYVHDGQWRCMDTYRDVEELNGLWASNPFWKIWQ